MSLLEILTLSGFWGWVLCVVCFLCSFNSNVAISGWNTLRVVIGFFFSYALWAVALSNIS